MPKLSKQKNPGEELFEWIYNRYKRMKVNDSWIHAMATEFDMDEFEDYLIRSSCFMLLRRLLWNAAWYNENYPDKQISFEKFEKEYMQRVFGFNPKERKMLANLVF
ncbi:MAG: hypothetical protein GY749_43005 [Desulfobacteraceae bacterium]|nr:hypothetical protein [Desulfobacteraceae bacterium]